MIMFILLITAVFTFCHVQCAEQRYLTNDASFFENKYRLRVKRPLSSCENTIQYSGYIDNLDTKEHIFFLFSESRFAPKTDPVVLSLSGESGCSSVLDSWFETGLCLINETNPYSFTNVANMLYIDQPSDVGYSYTEGKRASTSEQVAESIYVFLQYFFAEFKQYSKNDFHIMSDSYASHYIPTLATRIIRENRYAHVNRKIPIQLASIIIGNGYIHPDVQELSYVDYACDNDNAQYKPIYDKTTCHNMKNDRRRCKLLMDQCKQNVIIGKSCMTASFYCKRTQLDPFTKTGLNPYDIRKKCSFHHSSSIRKCYPDIQAIENYANQQSVITEYGVDSKAGRFQHCNSNVKYRFQSAKDHLNDVMIDLERILATPVRILVYAGDMNWHNNWYGQMAWLSRLDWIGQVEFNEAKDKNWISYVSGAKAGLVKTCLNLAFVRVFDAGQYAVHDQPANMIDLFSRWLLNIPLSN